ncbi:recombinase family protein [Lentzea kentuckyensis]|uniref:recombinase family protein n=1 Tax=Lentzea kentuckyensis TaxID=360086 RepID=UPI0013028DA7|nr:recombinase family protein [Lentzea kentuckyensis]
MPDANAIVACIYLRLSDLRHENMKGLTVAEFLAVRVRDLRKFGEERLGWTIPEWAVVIENDVIDKNAKPRKTKGKEKAKRQYAASAFKRKRVVLPDGRTTYRVIRPGFTQVMGWFEGDKVNALLSEDLDRTFRDPIDLEEFIIMAGRKKLNARSVSGSLTFTDGGTDSEIDMARFGVTIANRSSRDTARRVSAGRKRKAEAGEFAGGIRRFGLELDGITHIAHEVDVVRVAIDRVLMLDTKNRAAASIRGMARELRDADVPTVTGAEWTGQGLRDILLRPLNAGISIHLNEEVGRTKSAPMVPEWKWRRAVELLTDESRKTNAGAAPKWQGTGVYMCGRCGNGSTVQVNGGTKRANRYFCPDGGGHMTRNRVRTDEVVDAAVVARLSRPDAIDLIPSDGPKREEVDLDALRQESALIRKNLDELAEDRVLGLVTRAQFLKAAEVGNARLEEIESELCRVTSDSPLRPLVEAGRAVAGSAGVETPEEIRARVAAVWAAQPLAVRQAVISTLFTVTLVPTSKRGGPFDVKSVVIEPKVAGVIQFAQRAPELAAPEFVPAAVA